MSPVMKQPRETLFDCFMMFYARLFTSSLLAAQNHENIISVMLLTNKTFGPDYSVTANPILY